MQADVLLHLCLHCELHSIHKTLLVLCLHLLPRCPHQYLLSNPVYPVWKSVQDRLRDRGMYGLVVVMHILYVLIVLMLMHPLLDAVGDNALIVYVLIHVVLERICLCMIVVLC